MEKLARQGRARQAVIAAWSGFRCVLRVVHGAFAAARVRVALRALSVLFVLAAGVAGGAHAQAPDTVVGDPGGGDAPAAHVPWTGEVATPGDGTSPAADTPFDPARLALLPQLRVGLVLDPAAGDFDRAAPFREALERGLRLPVLLVAYRDLSRLQRALVAGEVDYAPLSASAYAKAQRTCRCLVPLLSPRAADGSAGWHAVALVARDSPLQRLADLAGTRVATGPLQSTGARRVPLAALAAEGLDAERDLAALVAHANPLAAADAVRRGEADVSFGWSSLRGDADEGYSRGTLRDLFERDGTAASLRILWASPPIPNAAHAARDTLPEPIRAAIVELLSETAEGEGGFEAARAISPFGFVPVEAQDYAPVLATFDGQAGSPAGRLRPLSPPR